MLMRRGRKPRRFHLVGRLTAFGCDQSSLSNHLYNVAANDGTVVGGVQNNTPFEPLFGTKAATYDPLKFNWLGTPSFEVAIASVWHKTPVNSWQDTRTREITMAPRASIRRRASTDGC